MRKSFVLLLTGLLAVLILSACGQKSQEDIVNGLDKKAKEYTSYKAKAKMTIQTGSDPQVYNVEIWHKNLPCTGSIWKIRKRPKPSHFTERQRSLCPYAVFK